MPKRSFNRSIEITGLDFQPRLPEGFEFKAYRRIDLAVDEIFNKKPSTVSFEEVHNDVDTLCAYGKSADLYASVVNTCRSHIKKKVNGIRL